MMKLSLVFLSLLTAGVLSKPDNKASKTGHDIKFRRRLHPRDFYDPVWDFRNYGHSSALFDDFGRFRGGSFLHDPFGGPFSTGHISGTAPTFAEPPALDVASAAPATLPPIPASPPVSPAPVDGAAPVTPAPVDGAAPVTPAPVDGAAPVTPAPVDGAAPVTPAPVDGAAPVTPAPVDAAAPVTPAPVDGAAPVTPAPVDGAAPGNTPNFAEPPPLDVASASPGVTVDPTTFQGTPGSTDPATPPSTPASPGTPPTPDTITTPNSPPSPGTAADLGPIAAVNSDPTSPNSDTVNNAIASFNNNIAPTLEQGSPVDHSGDKDIRLGVDLFNKQHGGRSGITVGNKDFQAGIYRDFNPRRPLDYFDSSKPQRPAILGIKANF